MTKWQTVNNETANKLFYDKYKPMILIKISLISLILAVKISINLLKKHHN